MSPSLGYWLDDDRPWVIDAACRGADPAVFFAGTDGGDTRLAQRICAGCPVVKECLAWALSTGVAYGVWGGTTEADRRGRMPQIA